MKSLLRCAALGLLLIAPVSALAQTPTVSAISDLSLNAGTTRTVNVVAVSAGTAITLTSSLPSFATLNAPTTGTGVVATTISLAPTAGNAGTYNASVTASSGALSSTENFVITVNAAGTNQAPIVSAPLLQNVTAGNMVTFNVTATDSEAINTFTATGLPSGASFTPNGTNTSGTFAWTPSGAQVGDYDVTFTATNSLSGSATTHLHVVSGANAAPVLTAPATRTVNEGQTVAFTVTATDSNGDHVTLTAGTLPDGASVSDQGNNSLNFSWQPNFTQAGTYTITFTGNDGHGGTGTATTVITVNDVTGSCVNAPVLTAPSSRTVVEGQTLTFAVTATDADGDHVTLSTGTLPVGATANDQGNNSLNFSWQPTTSQAGTYVVTFYASDGHCNQVAATTSITVQDSGGGGNCVNPPTLSAPATRTVTEGQTVAFTVTASDADGDHVTLTTGTLPSGASASDQGNNTLNFSWQPNTSQAGTYTVTFFGSDGKCNQVSATTTITVLDSNGGGGGTGQANVKIIGIFNVHNDRTCFRITPVNGSFNPNDVDLSTFTFQFNGTVIPASAGRVHVVTDCEDENDDGGDCNDAARLNLGGGHPHGHGDGEGDDDDDDDCDSCNDDCNDCHNDDNCDAVGIRACFSTRALLDLLGDNLADDLANATIHFKLDNGTEIVASFTSPVVIHGNNGKGHLHAMAKPNPLNPSTKLSFTLSQGGRVQVSVYDTQGRLVTKLHDGILAPGPQTLIWDGSNSRNGHVASGVYFFRIQAPEGQEVKRVAVVK